MLGDKSLIVFAFSVVAVGALIMVMIALTKKRSPRLDKEAYQVDFLRIENSLKRESEASYAMAIINGDKLLDRALCQLGVAGRTMGDRLKKVGNSKFTQLNSVWHAHKIRNQIAHESDFAPTYAQAQHALATYKQALKDLGAI